MEPKFNLNRPPINDEEINSNKDFGELVKKFKKQSIEKARTDTSFLKNKKITYSSVIAGVAVICTVTYFSVFKKDPPKHTTHDKIITNQNSSSSSRKSKPTQAFIAPPVSKLNVPYSSYKVKSEHGATINHTSKSKIIIPKKAFIDKQGNDIVGDVEIRYREFHNQADIIVSGIPMRYDSAGIKTCLESAGMLDIRGYQNDEPIFIKPDKIIIVEFASEYSADKYNMYVLDTVAKNWIYAGRDNSLKGLVGVKETNRLKGQQEQEIVESAKIKELQNRINAIPPKIEIEKKVYEKKVAQLSKTVQPSVPNKATAGRPQFQLDVNYKEFPELEAFKNAVFEVGAENKNYNSKLADVTWASATISEGPQKGKNYLLTLALRERVEKLVVYPALTGADYDKALKSYEEKFATYKTNIIKREANEKKLKEEFEAKQAAFIAEQKKLNEAITQEQIRQRVAMEKQMTEQAASMGDQQKVTRIFAVGKFGYCNSDCPTLFPKEATMHPIFVINNGASFVNPNTIHLVCHNKNLVFSFHNEPVLYNPKDLYSICILSKGKIFTCDMATFSKCIASKQTKIPVKELSDDVDEPNGLRMALGI